MGMAENTSRWFAPWRERAPVQQDDPADMGTAFGLEMSLTPFSAEAATPTSGTAKAGWLQRLAERRKPGA
jgi:hypothetical protein